MAMAMNNSNKNKVELARQRPSAQAYANNHDHTDGDDLAIILEACITDAESKPCYAMKRSAICKFLHKVFNFLLQSSWQETLVEVFVDSLCALVERKASGGSPEINMILAEIYAEVLHENIAAAAIGGEIFSVHNMLLKPLFVLLAQPSTSLCFSIPDLNPGGLAVAKSVFSLLLSCPDSALQQNLVLVRSLVESAFYTEEEENLNEISKMCLNDCVKDMEPNSVIISDVEDTEEGSEKEVDSGKELNLKDSVIMDKQDYDSHKEEWGDDCVIVNREEQFEMAATTSITIPGSRSSPIGSSNGSSAGKRKMTEQKKRVRFALERNVEWWPGTPLPPESQRLPPSVKPRGSALKKDVPAGPVRPGYFTKSNIRRSPQDQDQLNNNMNDINKKKIDNINMNDSHKQEWGDDSVIVNGEEQFEMVATTSITNPGSTSSPFGSSNGSSAGQRKMTEQKKKVRFALEQNVEWWPGTPLPPESQRLPPSVKPRGSALKKGVPAGPVRPSYFTKSNIRRSLQGQLNNNMNNVNKKKIDNNNMNDSHKQEWGDDSVIVNGEEQFEMAATTSITNPGSTSSPIGSSNGSNAGQRKMTEQKKRVRFALEQNVEWWPGTPLPPESQRLPPSVKPRGSALKKDVPVGPVRPGYFTKSNIRRSPQDQDQLNNNMNDINKKKIDNNNMNDSHKQEWGDDSVIVNGEEQFEMVATTSITNPGSTSSPIGSSNGSSAGQRKMTEQKKRVRFALEQNVEWWPGTPLPPESQRLPPSVKPRGSALKKGVPAGPVRPGYFTKSNIRRSPQDQLNNNINNVNKKKIDNNNMNDSHKQEWGDDSVIVNGEEQFEMAATTSITNPGSTSSPIGSSNGSNAGQRKMTEQKKRVRFALEQNVEWWPGTPLPPESQRLPPSVKPRGSALKKDVPVGPVRPGYFTNSNIRRSPQNQLNKKKKKKIDNNNMNDITNRRRYHQQQQDDRIRKGSSAVSHLLCSRSSDLRKPWIL